MWALMLIMACDEFGLKSQADDTADAEGTDCSVFCIEDISPSYGPTAGGTPVNIRGKGFDGDVGVAFGRMELNVTIIDNENIAITSPAFGEEGTVDVTIWSDLGEEVINDGFTFTDSGPPPEDTGNSDSGSGGSNPTPTGLTGGLVRFGLQVDPYHLLSTQDYILNANATLHTPVNGSWFSWITPVGSCSWDLNPTNLGLSSNSLGSWVYLSNATQSISMQQSQDQNNNSNYAATNLTSDKYTKGTGYNLDAPDIGLEVQNAMVTASGLGTFSPVEYFTSSTPEYNYYQSNATTFTWTPDTDPNSSMWFIIQVYDPAATYLGGFQCRAPDNGAYRIPAELFEGALAGDALAIQFYRLRLGSAIHPENGSTIESFSITGAVGLATFLQ